jgi:hypothetical protein
MVGVTGWARQFDDPIPFAAVWREPCNSKRLAVRADGLDPVVAALAAVGRVRDLADNYLRA